MAYDIQCLSGCGSGFVVNKVMTVLTGLVVLDIQCLRGSDGSVGKKTGHSFNLSLTSCEKNICVEKCGKIFECGKRFV